MEAVDGFFGLIALIVLHANRGKSVDAGGRHSHSDAGRIPIRKRKQLAKKSRVQLETNRLLADYTPLPR
jgi:hypothetical protein